MGRSFFMSENMKLKGIYTDKPAIFQIFILLVFMLAGGLLATLIGTGMLFFIYGTDALSSNMAQYPEMLRSIQFISSIFMFLFPALAIAWTCSNNPLSYLSIRKIPNNKILFYVFISMFLFSPTISLTGVLNKQIELPTFLAPIENWMRTQEDAAEQITEYLLSGNGIFVLLSNLLVIAITAAITEEFLFRGTIQKIMGKWTVNYHIIIWGTAFIFSAFHLQFFGFIPRLLLGAYFGYLLYWSKCIWIPVFAHFVNNATAVIVMSNGQWKENEFMSGNITNAHLMPFACASLLTLFAFIALNKHLRDEMTKE